MEHLLTVMIECLIRTVNGVVVSWPSGRDKSYLEVLQHPLGSNCLREQPA